MGVSVGWIFLLAPEIAAIVVLNFCENVLSQFPYQHQILYHYSLPAVPVLVLGTLWAIARQKTQWRKIVATTATVACAFSACVLWGLAPFSLHSYPHMSPNSPEVQDINRVEAALPANAVVSAWYPYVAHIDHRTRVYMWPTPFSASDWGLYDQEGQRLSFAGEIQYLLLPTGGGGDPKTFASIAQDYKIIDRSGDVVLYEKIGPIAGKQSSGNS
jgi:hypothetical protein